MPILHDNRNMRPDLLQDKTESVDDIFALADKEMQQQRQSQLFTPKKKRIYWKSVLKKVSVVTVIFAIIILCLAGVWSFKMARNTMVSEVQTQVLKEVRQMKSSIAAKSESELTDEDRFMLEIFDVLTEEEICNIIQTATSTEEIINFLIEPNLDFSRYLTIEQKIALEDISNRYAEKIGTEIVEYEKKMEEEELMGTTYPEEQDSTEPTTAPPDNN